MNQIILITAFVVTLIASQVCSQDQFYGKQEAQCLQQGGLCILSSECEKKIEADRELCPEQAAKGFQCCFGLPKHEKRCRRHGGECFKRGYCNQKLVYRDASDCAEEQDCCILV